MSKKLYDALNRMSTGSSKKDVVTVAVTEKIVRVRRQFSADPLGHLEVSFENESETPALCLSFPGKVLRAILRSVTENAEIMLLNPHRPDGLVIKDDNAKFELLTVDGMFGTFTNDSHVMFYARVDAQEFRKALEKVRTTAGKSRSYHAPGYELAVCDGAMTICTDKGYSRSMASLPAEGDAFTVAVPKNAVSQFLRRIRIRDTGQAEIIVTVDGNVQLKLGSLSCWTEMVENVLNVTKWQQKHAEDFEDVPVVEMDVEELTNALKLVDKITPRDRALIATVSTENITLVGTAENDRGTGESVVKCSLNTEMDFEPMRYIGLPHDTVLAWLKKVKQEKITVAFDAKAVRFSADEKNRIYVSAQLRKVELT